MTKLKQVRLSNGLTQSAVAEKLGITLRMYQYLEVSKRRPSWEVAEKLEDLFQIPARELLKKEAV
jgi:transcriptional regulator with XRE-family HTH domain